MLLNSKMPKINNLPKLVEVLILVLFNFLIHGGKVHRFLVKPHIL